MLRPCLLLCLAACASAPRADFDADFTGKTLEIGYAHHNFATAPVDPASPPSAGSAAAPRGEIDFRTAVVRSPWAGSRTALVDTTGFGKYRVELRDAATGRVLYTRGFASIYGEWETTPEFAAVRKEFEESVRVPEPRRPFTLALEKRGDDGAFHPLAERAFDLARDRVERGEPERTGEVVPLFVEGEPADRVDLLVVGDGYTLAQREKFVADARRLTGALFDTEPFRRRKADFAVRALFLPAREAGIDNPRKGIDRDNPLGLSYDAFGSERYVLTMQDAALRRHCAQAPYDALILLFNERKYGGGGIYNLWATCAADTEPAPYVFVHEFGHSFAGLADEYYSSQVAYEEFVKPGVEPWEPNVTALLDPARLKWKDLVDPGTPLPTPWDQAGYDAVDLAYQARRAELLAAKASEEEMEALFREVKASTGPLLEAEPHAGRVGAFEGASYEAKGLYRPMVDCIMFTRNPTAFCKVCERAIERTIDSYVR